MANKANTASPLARLVPAALAHPSGLNPLEYKIIVRPRKAEEKTKGGIHLPEIVVEKDQHASMEGEVIAVSPIAFNYDPAAPKASVGETVVFARYSGVNVKGNDGVDYRVMNDKDVLLVRRSA